MVKLTVNQQIIYDAFVAQGLPPELGLATAQLESAFNPNAGNITGGDGARGGAFGLGQITVETALALDRTATPAKLMNPQFNANLMARLTKENWVAAHGRVQDVISRYNSGRDFWRAPDGTKLVYTPRVERFMAEWKKKLADKSE